MRQWTIDNTVELTCVATGNPPPLVSWQKEESDGSFVPLPGEDGQWRLTTSVIRVELSDDTYRCAARNSQGENYEKQPLSLGELYFFTNIRMVYWPSGRSRERNIDQVLFLRVDGIIAKYLRRIWYIVGTCVLIRYLGRSGLDTTINKISRHWMSVTFFSLWSL